MSYQPQVTKSGTPRFRTTPEFEEKFCTRCSDYWPCDAEFFRRNCGSWSPWCRACEAEAQRVSRAKANKPPKRAAAFFSAIALAAAAASADASTYCDSVAKLATAMQTVKEQGMTRHGMAEALTTVSDDEVRATSAAVLRLIYDGNADNGLTPIAMGRLARAACLTTEPNAMNARTP